MNNISKVFNTIEKTIGFDLSTSGVKAMSSNECYEWHKKHARINSKGNLVVSSDEIGDGTFEEKYKQNPWE